MPAETREAHQQVKWSSMARMRDRLVHNYFEGDLDIVWDVLPTKIVPQCDEVRRILRAGRQLIANRARGSLRPCEHYTAVRRQRLVLRRCSEQPLRHLELDPAGRHSLSVTPTVSYRSRKNWRRTAPSSSRTRMTM